MKRSRFAGAIVVGSSLALAAGLMAPAANAASTKFTVTAGSAKAGVSALYVGTTKSVKFKTPNASLSCTGATAGGGIKVGKNESGTKIGTITGSSTTWKGCTGPGGITLNPKGSGTWSLNAASYKSGVTTGTISNVTATVTSVPAGACSFTVTGSVPITYTNKGEKLAVSGSKATLVVSKVSGCLGLLKNGDKSSFAATYTVKTNKPLYSPIAIAGS